MISHGSIVFEWLRSVPIIGEVIATPEVIRHEKPALLWEVTTR